MPTPPKGRERAAPSTDIEALRAAIIAAYRQMDPDDLRRRALLDNTLERINRPAFAALLKVANPRLTGDLIATMVGVNRTTLYSWPEFKRAAESSKRVDSLPRGSFDADGDIEAWEA